MTTQTNTDTITVMELQKAIDALRSLRVDASVEGKIRPFLIQLENILPLDTDNPLFIEGSRTRNIIDALDEYCTNPLREVFEAVEAFMLWTRLLQVDMPENAFKPRYLEWVNDLDQAL